MRAEALVLFTVGIVEMAYCELQVIIVEVLSH